MNILSAAPPPAQSRAGVSAPVSAEPRLSRWWTAASYAGFAVTAAVVLLLAGQPLQQIWGEWAVAGYGLAALAAAAWRTHGRDLALLLSLAGAFLVPLRQVTIGHGVGRLGEESLRVISRSAELLMRHGSPYLPATRLNHFITYNPYEPLMAVFGLPGTLGLRGAAANPRLWMCVTAVGALAAAFRLMRPRGAAWFTLFAIGSPVLALELTGGQTDVPVLALLCLALALASRVGGRVPTPALAGLALGVACAMKATAWPAIPVMIAMLAARDGLRAVVKFTAASLLSAAVLMIVAAPAEIIHTAGLFQNTVLFPLGMTPYPTPAASLLPGYLLAAAGPAGHLAAVLALAAVALGMALSLIFRPPADVPAACTRLALGLALMFTLAPASRWGYFVYPAGLIGFALLVAPAADGPVTSRIMAGWHYLRERAVPRADRRPAAAATAAD